MNGATTPGDERTAGSVLITGAAGFIGSALVEALLATGRAVVAVDRDGFRLHELARRLPFSRLRVEVADVTAADPIASIARTTKPATIVHLAALHMIPQCERSPGETIDVNLGGLRNTLVAAGHAGVSFVLFASTADVYAPAHTPHDESHPTRPSTVYGNTKLLGERLVAEWAASSSGRRATSMRIFNVYGPGDRNPHVIPDLLRELRSGEVVRMGNVDTRRDFIHVDDLVSLMCRVLDSPVPPEQVNAGTGDAVSIAELLALVQGLLGRPLAWTSVSSRTRVQDRPHLEADPTRARSLYPNFTTRALSAGLRELMAVVDPFARPSDRSEP